MTLSYDDLVTAATAGIARKPVAVTGLGGPAAGYDGVLDAGDPAAALLDAAALLTVARRAGVQPRRGVTLPAPPADPAPALSARAVEALRQLCWPAAGYWHRSAPLREGQLLAGLLNAAADAGYVAPGQLLADLLNASLADPAARPAVGRVLGARGRWLLQYRREWRDSLAARSGPDTTPGPETWRSGIPDERLAYLIALRDRDPAGARDLLAAAWAQEHGRDRARFIGVLSRHLSLADEEFLETALRDRAATVRAQVPPMLVRLAGSAFVRRASERAAGLLRLDRERPGLRLQVSMPGKPDPAAARDGIAGKPPAPAIDESAWRLTQMLSPAPLTDWTTRFDLSPREILALPVEGGLRADVHAGWRLAASIQADAEWARALLDAGRDDDVSGTGARGDGTGRPPEAWPPDRLLAAVLPPGEWATVLLADVSVSTSGHRSAGSSEHDQHSDAMLQEVAAYPPPWPDDLADAVIAAFDREMPAIWRDPPAWRTRRSADALLLAAGRRCPRPGTATTPRS